MNEVLDVRGLYAGARFLVFGGTGFLGKVWLSMVLDRYPEVEHVYLIVRQRTRKDGSIRLTSEERFWSEVATSPVFDPIRAKVDDYEGFLRSKITPIHGDVSDPFAGVSQEIRDQIRGTISALVNSAGIVDFTPPLDYGLKANAFGMKNLVDLARDLGDIKFLHTSTCYVAGDRTGQVDEVDPREFPFPKADELEPSHWDPEREIAECVDVVEHVRHRVNDAWRQSAFLDEAKKNLREQGEPTRGSALEDELKKVKRRFEDKWLVEQGMERAKFWGWHNTYTYTKSIGEQILCDSGLTFTIARPAVIESAISYPSVGWNEGINTSAPLIYLALQAPFQYPGEDDSVLDIIPVDYVSAGMILALAELLEGTHKPVYQLGSSDTSPLPIKRLIELVGLYRRRHYLHEAGGHPLVNWFKGHVESTPITAAEHYKFGAGERGKQVTRLSQTVRRFSVGPLKPFAAPAAKALAGLGKELSVAGRIVDLFVPFMATHSYRFSCANTRAALARVSEEERALIPWAPETIQWREYLLEVHCPGIEKNVVPLIKDKIKKPLQPRRPHDDLNSFIDELAERHDLATALMLTTDEGFERVSFRDLLERSMACAARLIEAGVRPGDRVAISGANAPEWPIACFGIFRAGAVAVPLDPALSPAQVQNIAETASVEIALLDAEARDAFGAVFSGPVIDLHDVAAAGPFEGLPHPETKPDDLASVLFTSGTTGAPKGVMLTHGNFCSLLASLGRLFPLRESDRVLSVLPLHHTFEFSCGLLLPLSRGARVIYLDEINGERLGYGLREGRVTAMVGVPALWQLLERRIRSQVKERGKLFEIGFDLGLDLNRMIGKQTGLDVGRLFFGSVHDRLGGNIRILISGAAALPKDTQTLFSGLGLHLAEGYGLTEAAPVLTVAKGAPGAKPGTVGKPIPGVEIRISDPNDQGIGEVQARGPNVMQGYFGNDAATSAVLTEDGWLRTGDLGKIDHRGQLTLMGRAKEVVVSASGENIYLDDVENAIGNVRYVKEYGTVGLPDPRGGERLGLLAVPDADEHPDVDRASLHARARDALRESIERLPSSQRPAVLHLVDADLPRTASRKVKRREVKEILERIEAAAPQRATRGGDVAAPVARAIAAVAGVPNARVTSSTQMAGDLGFDSLMWVELASALDGVGSRPDPDDLARCETVADVVALVGAPPPEIIEEEDPRDNVRIPTPLVSPLRGALGWAQRSLYGQGLNTRVVGRAFIPQNRQAIVVSNHCSHLDMGLVKYALGPYGHKLVALAAKDYFFEGNPWVVAYFEQLTNLQPIDRKRGFRASFNQAKDVVDGGNVVLLFPEGTRRTDGTIGEFKPLVGKLALEAGVDILPMHLDGTFDVLPKGAVLPRGRDVTVRIGPPLRIEDLRRLTDGMRSSEAARIAATLAQSAVESLRDGSALDIGAMTQVVEAEVPDVDPVTAAFESLVGRFDPSRISEPISWYWSLDGKTGPRWSITVDADGCQVRPGKPAGGSARCVVKTSGEVARKIICDAWVPGPPEFFSGAIKTNEIPLLIEFSRVFDLSEVSF